MISSVNDDFQQALFSDGHLRALLRLFHFEEREVPGENTADENAEDGTPIVKNWYISLTILANDLDHYAQTVQEYMETPLETEKSLDKLIKRKKAKAPRISNRAERSERSKEPRPEKSDKYLSAQFVEDSDDDEETKLVAEYRARMDNMRNAEYQLTAEDSAEEINQIQRQLEQLSQAPVPRRRMPKKQLVGEEKNDEDDIMDDGDAEMHSSPESDRDDVDEEEEASALETEEEAAHDTSSDSSDSDSDNDSDQENAVPRVQAPLEKTVEEVQRDAPQNAVNKRRRLLIADVRVERSKT